jgi:hypothetical protein
VHRPIGTTAADWCTVRHGARLVWALLEAGPCPRYATCIASRRDANVSPIAGVAYVRRRVGRVRYVSIATWRKFVSPCINTQLLYHVFVSLGRYMHAWRRRGDAPLRIHETRREYNTTCLSFTLRMRVCTVYIPDRPICWYYIDHATLVVDLLPRWEICYSSFGLKLWIDSRIVMILTVRRHVNHMGVSRNLI